MNRIFPSVFLFSVAVFFIFSARLHAQQWSPLGGGLLGPSGSCLEFYRGELYAGGTFASADTLPNVVNYIARWDGAQWHDVGGGASHSVYTLYAHGDHLYAGGRFAGIGGLTGVRGIARWDGTAWDSLGGGVSPLGGVNAIIEYNGNIVAAGEFSAAGNTPANNIAMWDGASWTAMGSGVTGGRVNALAVHNGELYAGGSFYFAGNDTVYSIAKWDGVSWSGVGPGFYGAVSALKTFGGKLIACGAFYFTVDLQTVRGLAQWDGTSWSPVGFGADDPPVAMALYANKLYIGGYFSSIDNVPANQIASWDGTTFSPLGTGTGPAFTSSISAIAADDGILYAAGTFDTAGSLAVNHIAKWSNPGVGMNETGSASTVAIFPNPNNGVFTIDTRGIFGNKFVEVYDALGKKVSYIEMRTDVAEIDLPEEGAGIYFYRVIADGKPVASGRIISR
jgi:hypothetical protein